MSRRGGGGEVALSTAPADGGGAAEDKQQPAASRAEEGVAPSDVACEEADAPSLPPPRPALARLRGFWRKFHGDPSAAPAPLRPPAAEAVYAAVAGGVAISCLAGLHLAAVAAKPRRLEQLIAPFGASAVLVFATPNSPLAQPRNVFFGNTVSALVGCVVEAIFGGRLPWLAPGLAVGFAILAMALTGCVHPPAGAVALTALARDPAGRPHGFLFVAMPTATGSALLVLMAMLFNNLHPRQKYPLRWW